MSFKAGTASYRLGFVCEQVAVAAAAAAKANAAIAADEHERSGVSLCQSEKHLITNVTSGAFLILGLEVDGGTSEEIGAVECDGHGDDNANDIDGADDDDDDDDGNDDEDGVDGND